MSVKPPWVVGATPRQPKRRQSSGIKLFIILMLLFLGFIHVVIFFNLLGFTQNLF